MDTLAIIKRIELRLAELGMSKAEFYEKSGISSASYSQWNTGKYNPSRTKIQQAAAVLGLDLDYLCYGYENKENAPTVSGERNVSDAKAAFFEGYGDDLSEEEKDELWEDARVYARFKAQQKK